MSDLPKHNIPPAPFSHLDALHFSPFEEGETTFRKNWDELEKVKVNLAEVPEAEANAILGQLARSKGLRSLILEWEGEHFPSLLTQFPKLQHLFIRNSKLKSIPNAIGKLDRLRTLELNCTYLIGLPSSIGKMKKLRNLSLAVHFLESLPGSFVQLQALEHLEIYIEHLWLKKDWGKNYEFAPRWKQPLVELFDMLGQLPQLKFLEITEGFNFSQSAAPSGKSLFPEIPENISGLRNLQTLMLIMAAAQNLPPSIRELSRLKWIQVQPYGGPADDFPLNNYFPEGDYVKVEGEWWFRTGL